MWLSWIQSRYGRCDAPGLPDLEKAKATAVFSSREVLADNVKSHAANPLTEVIITDQNGVQLATIPAKDILPERLQ